METHKEDFKINDPNEFGCHLFKFPNVVDLLAQLDERVDLMKRVSNGMFDNVSGINFKTRKFNFYVNLIFFIQKLFISLHSQLTKYYSIIIN